jgi:predicted patatin/cPLA2 family phospholipase
MQRLLMTIKKIFLRFTLLLVIVFLTGCATTRPEALPEKHAEKLPWGAIDLDISKSGHFTLRNSLGSALLKKVHDHSHVENQVPFDILSLSGGGTRGAFGAGILSGWEDSGAIPVFDIVTGVSTGAVMAPFAFLGGDELDKIEWFYTKSNTDDVYTSSWFSFFGDAYLMNPAPLKKLFLKAFNEAFLNKIAAEHAKGRRLYVGTTNIDTGQFVVWDMGAIASSNRSDKYQHFADIIYASSAMPIFLPPQYIEVNIDDKTYYQMHVDGGIYAHVFMVGMLVNWEEVLDLRAHQKDKFNTTLYIVANRKYRNRHLYDPVEQSASEIIAAYINIETDLLFDKSIYRLYTSSVKKGINFRMAAVPEYANSVDDSTEFNPEKMQKLFNVGYNYGLKGINWQKSIAIDEYDNR